MTEKAKQTRAMVVPGASVWVEVQVNPDLMRLRRDAEPLQVKLPMPYFQEKLLASTQSARTPNRHRWTGRAYPGA